MNDDAMRAQTNAALVVARAALEDSVTAAYLYGSAVMRGLKPASDLDLLVVINRPSMRDERLSLIDALAPISNRDKRPAGWRPVELTTVVLDGDSARLDFQYGEWLGDEFAVGNVERAASAHVDLPILIAMVRDSGASLFGPTPTEILPAVSRHELVAAMTDSIPGLVGDIETDRSNVLLTLARILSTLANDRFSAKDEAAEWVIEHLSHHQWPALKRARDVYLGAVEDDWGAMQQAAATEADRLVGEIGRPIEPS